MTPEDIPVLGTLFEVGAKSRLYDAMMLLGPILIVLIAIVGRTEVTTVSAGIFVITLPLYILFQSVYT